jgi:hypothetical protein
LGAMTYQTWKDYNISITENQALKSDLSKVSGELNAKVEECEGLTQTVERMTFTRGLRDSALTTLTAENAKLMLRLSEIRDILEPYSYGIVPEICNIIDATLTPPAEPTPEPKRLRVVDGNRLMYGEDEVLEYTHWDEDLPKSKEVIDTFTIRHLMVEHRETHFIIVNGERIKVEPSMFDEPVTDAQGKEE